VRASEASQVEERVDAEMPAILDRRIKQSWRSGASTNQQLLELCKSKWIRGEVAASAMNGAIRPLPVILNETFRPGHKFPQFLNRRVDDGDTRRRVRFKAVLPMTARSSLPASESGLALGEIHRINIIPSGR
jgi:hypothetical protein